MAAFEELDSRRRSVNERSGAWAGFEMLPSTSLPLRGEQSPELGFLRLASWLWSIYFETGRSAVEAVQEMAREELRAGLGHVGDVRTLRTYAQHHLQYGDNDDDEKRSAALVWLASHADIATEDEEIYWIRARQGLLDEANSFLSSLEEYVDRIRHSELSDEVRLQLTARMERSVPAFVVDRLILELRGQYGLDYLDPKVFREIHYSRWREQLCVTTRDQDSHQYLRSLIEQAMAAHVEREPAPLSGDEIMDCFGLPPGRLIRDLKAIAEQEAARGIRSKRALVERIATITGRAVLSFPDEP